MSHCLSDPNRQFLSCGTVLCVSDYSDLYWIRLTGEFLRSYGYDLICTTEYALYFWFKWNLSSQFSSETNTSEKIIFVQLLL